MIQVAEVCVNIACFTSDLGSTGLPEFADIAAKWFEAQWRANGL